MQTMLGAGAITGGMNLAEMAGMEVISEGTQEATKEIVTQGLGEVLKQTAVQGAEQSVASAVIPVVGTVFSVASLGYTGYKMWNLYKNYQAAKDATVNNTSEPTTIQPTTNEPTTIESSPIEPTTIEPTTIKPTTIEPTTIEPTTTEPTTTTITTSALDYNPFEEVKIEDYSNVEDYLQKIDTLLELEYQNIFLAESSEKAHKGSSKFLSKLKELFKRWAKKDACPCNPKCGCGKSCTCLEDNKDKRDDTPYSDPEKFDKSYPNENGKAWEHKDSGEVYAEDTFHGDHYDVYKNSQDFKNRKKPKRHVWFTGISKKVNCCDAKK